MADIEFTLAKMLEKAPLVCIWNSQNLASFTQAPRAITETEGETIYATRSICGAERKFRDQVLRWVVSAFVVTDTLGASWQISFWKNQESQYLPADYIKEFLLSPRYGMSPNVLFLSCLVSRAEHVVFGDPNDDLQTYEICDFFANSGVTEDGRTHASVLRSVHTEGYFPEQYVLLEGGTCLAYDLCGRAYRLQFFMTRPITLADLA